MISLASIELNLRASTRTVRWCKMSTLELATRIPLIIRAPWIKTAVNATTNALVEAVDLYPTIVELAGLSLPSGPC